MAIQPSLRPEEELLLDCARPRPAAPAAGQPQPPVATDLDWAYLAGIAGQHAIQPLLYWRLKAICSEAVPPAILAQLQAEFKANAWRSHFLSRELGQLVELFAGRRLPVIPLKGVILAAALYDNLALRQAGDLDLLVSPQDFPQAAALLIDRGYRPAAVTREPATGQPIHHDAAFSRTENGRLIWVDLHRQLMPPYLRFPLTFESLWTRRQSIMLAGRPVPHLSPEDLLLYLCVHGSRHAWPNLKWLVDVTELIDRHRAELDWAAILARAEAGHSRRMLRLGLLLAHSLLATEMPPAVLAEIETDHIVEGLAGQVSARLFQSGLYTPAGVWTRFLFRLNVLDSRRDQAGYLAYFLKLRVVDPFTKNR